MPTDQPPEKPLPPELTECLKAQSEDPLAEPDQGEKEATVRVDSDTTASALSLCGEAQAVFEILGLPGGQQFLGLLLLKGYKVARCTAAERRVVMETLGAKPAKPVKTILHNDHGLASHRLTRNTPLIPRKN